ncbi:MAG TPA: GNAT family N-acetyltransferase [Chthoniobacterales bacterium]
MTPLNIAIDYLANHPELADELGKISWNEWRPIYEQRGETFADAVRKYRERANIGQLPLALVALAEGDEGRPFDFGSGQSMRAPALIGTVSLKYCDLDIRPELDPWLGGVFVVPEWRGRGIASLLCRRAMEAAARLTISNLYLWTHSAEGLYLKLGWRAIERTDYCGKKIVIMRMTIQ